MAQKDLKLLWGSNTKMNGSSQPAIVDGKAYFAIVDGDTKYPDAAAPANEAFIYLDKDSTRYNVIAKRAIFDALGNKINSTYATDIESSGNTMSLFSADGGEAIDTAKIINSLSVDWASSSYPTTAGPRIRITVNGSNSSYVAVPVAGADAAGVVTTGTQTFTGAKTFSGAVQFTNNTASSNTTTGAVVITGGLGVGGNINGGAAISAATTLTAGTSATIGTTLTTGGNTSIGGDLTVVGKDIFLGNTTGKIVTLSANDDGNQVTLGNASASTYLVRLDGTAATSNGIELWNGANSSWKMINDGGHLYFQNNYTTELEDYFDVLRLEYDTGNATIKGDTSVNTLTIRNTSGVGHLKFSRGNFNYITTPTSGKIAFIVNGQSIGEANAELIIQDGILAPGTHNATALGTANKNYSVLHTQNIKSSNTLYITPDSTLYLDSGAETSIIFRQGGTEAGRFDTAGKFKIVNGEYPSVTNTIDSGTSDLRWKTIYATTFNGTSFTGNAASATTVAVTDTTPDSTTSYYLLYSTGKSNNQTVRANADLFYYDTGTTSYLNVGSSTNKGALTLHDSSGYDTDFVPTTLTNNRTITVPDAGGTMMTSSNYSIWASPNTHKHSVTINHTPAGTISTPKFTGTSSQSTSANIGTVSVSSYNHTHTYTRISSINAPTPNYTSTNSGTPSATASFYAYPSTSKPSLTASITNKCLTVVFTSPTTQGYTVSSSSHKHTYDKTTSITAPTFSTSTYNSSTPSSTTTVPNNGHTHTYTAAGTISTPTFTGTAYSKTFTTTTQI